MSKKKPQDHLDYDVMRANELGYGPHYGNYKADHPETLAEYEALSGPKVEKADKDRQRKRKETTENVTD